MIPDFRERGNKKAYVCHGYGESMAVLSDIGIRCWVLGIRKILLKRGVMHRFVIGLWLLVFGKVIRASSR